MRPALRTDTGPPRIVRSWVTPWLQSNKQSGGKSERKRDKQVTHNAVKLAPFAAGRVEAGSARGTERLTLPRVSGAGDGGYDDERDA